MGGVAGETDEYRLSLGQVYYWLGKQADGHKLFDEYLTSKSRAVPNLMQIGAKLRQVGAVPEARALAEEAYGKGNTEEQHEAALFRSVIDKDPDDAIAWLNKADLSEPTVKASLAKALGNKAFEEGRDDEAVRQFHTAIDAYAAMPRAPRRSMKPRWPNIRSIWPRANSRLSIGAWTTFSRLSSSIPPTACFWRTQAARC